MDQGAIWFCFTLFYFQGIAGESTQNQAASAVTSGEYCCSSNLNDRVSKLEAQNSFQKEEIAFLKATVHQLGGRVETLEVEGKVTTRNDLITNRAKRPFRLLPAHVSR